MKIIHQLLESYNVGVNAGLDLKLNLWIRDGDEFFFRIFNGVFLNLIYIRDCNIKVIFKTPLM